MGEVSAKFGTATLLTIATVVGLHRRIGTARTARGLSSFFAATVLLLASASANAHDPLAAWNDGPAKQTIISFVQSVTDASGANFVEPKDRIATFDQDGTLWVEHPIYTQAMFALDRVRALAPTHSNWKQESPFNAILSGNREAIAKFGEADWERIVAATHSGMSTEVFLSEVRDWLSTARNPQFQRPYTALVYEPMLQLIKYLQSNGFRTYIVTGGGQEFTRAFSEDVYGIPPEQVVGSSILTKYQDKNGKPELMRESEPFFVDDGPGKAVGINLFIGKRPIAAFGNSSGDREMLEWTQAGGGRRLEMLVMHDDVAREYVYGPAQGLPDTKIGAFPASLYDEAQKNRWTVVSMKNDWNRIFSFAASPQTSQAPN